MQDTDSDAVLLQGLKKGQQAAFQRLYQLYYPMVRYLVIQNSGSQEEADDVFQDALLVLIEKLRGSELQLTASLKTFLYAICRNIWLKRLRSKGKTTLRDFEEVVDVPMEEPEPENEPMLQALRRCLNEIGEACRNILERYYFWKMSMEEIASEIGYANADTVKTQKYKCILRLRKLMEEQKR